MAEAQNRVQVSCLLCGNSRGEVLLNSRVQLAPATGEEWTFLRCPACELVYLSPRPTSEGIERYYPESYLCHLGPEAWGRYAPLVRGSERRLDRRRVRFATAAHPLGREARVLDVGCGRPTFLERLSREQGCRGVGIDLSDAGWRSDAERWRGLSLLRGRVIELKDALQGEAGPKGFDLISLWHALEHDETPLATLQALLTVARPGGTLLIEVPNLDSLSARRHGAHWGGFHTPRHTAAYTPVTLGRMVRDAGWEVVRQEPFGSLDPYLVWWLGSRVRRGDPLDGRLDRRFPGFLLGKALTLPLALLQRRISLGVQLLIARRPRGESSPPLWESGQG